MGTASKDASSWTDKSVKSGTQYRYTVRTVSGKLTSSFKGTSGLVYLSTPTVKIANASTGMKLTWNKITGASIHSKSFTNTMRLTVITLRPAKGPLVPAVCISKDTMLFT
jgi:hypothetical protein